MSFGREYSLRHRILGAVKAFILNVLLWVVVPIVLGTFLVKYVPDLPLGIPAFVLEFGVLFIALDVGAAFFQGKAISVPFLSGVAILSAVYLWFVTNGGNLHVTAAGTTISLEFQPLVYVFILPSVWAAVRAPLSYLIWRRARGGEPLEIPATMGAAGG